MVLYQVLRYLRFLKSENTSWDFRDFQIVRENKGREDGEKLRRKKESLQQKEQKQLLSEPETGKKQAANKSPKNNFHILCDFLVCQND